MCGLVGYSSKTHHEASLNAAVDIMRHRGPDHQDTSYCMLGPQVVGLGHARLSIIDLDARSNQPFMIADAQLRLVYNGEIYNFKELRDDLVACGHTFITESDTEVFLRAYLEYGHDAFRRFRGIFAAAIVDEKRKSLTLVRDPMGVKPLYYWANHNGEVFFASELKALFSFAPVPHEVDPYDLYQAVRLGFPIEPRTGFKDILKVPPGSFVQVKLEETCAPKRYFTPHFEGVSSTEEAEQLLVRACEEQDLADVPVGILFSGGTDSSVIAQLSPHADSLVFGRYDRKEMQAAGMIEEEHYASEIAQHLGKTLECVDISVSGENSHVFIEQARDIANQVEEPISDYTFLASYILCKVSARSGKKVVLSGMGGDEAFAGYPRYAAAAYHGALRSVRYLLRPIVFCMGKMRRFSKRAARFSAFLEQETYSGALSALLCVFSSSELQSLLTFPPDFKMRFENDLKALLKPVEHLSALKQAMYFDRFGFLAHNLLVADKSSMQASVEMRVPLLDHTVYEAALNLPDKALMQFFDGKLVLKSVLKKRLPKTLVQRPKTGFNPPLDDKIQGLGRDTLNKIFKGTSFGKYFNSAEANRLVDEHFDQKKNNTYKIWALLFFSQWLSLNV